MKIKSPRYTTYLASMVILSWLLYTILTYDPEWNKTYPATQGNTVTVFLIDGLSSEIFVREMNAGLLPNLKALADGGTYVRQGICSFPTMTGYGYYPFITGKDAPESGILGLRWFDRKRQIGSFRNYVGRTNIRMNEDLTDSLQNIFEQSKPYYTASINTFMNKGVTHNIKTGWEHTTAKYADMTLFRWLRAIPLVGQKLAPDHFEHETRAMDLAVRQLQKNPKVHWVTFPSPDASNHVHGTDTTYSLLLHHIDSLIGVYVAVAQKLGQGRNRMIAVVSDHGVSDVTENLDFCGWLQQETGLVTERGKSINLMTSKLDEPIESYQSLDGYFVINGNLAGYLYMKTPGLPPNVAWAENLTPELLESYPGPKGKTDIPKILSENPQIELVVYRGTSGHITVRNGRNKAEIMADTAGRLIYHPLEGNPLMYPTHLHHVALENSEWLDKTLSTPFPYGLVRIYSLMNHKSIGDVVITSRKGVDLAHDYELFVHNYKGGHGGLRKEIISVPFIYKKPGSKPLIANGMPNEDLGRIIVRHLAGD